MFTRICKSKKVINMIFLFWSTIDNLYFQDINEFMLLGQSTDNAPGEILDKISRRLGFHEDPRFRDMAGHLFLPML